MRRFQAQQRPAEGSGDEGGEHPADAGIAQRARFLVVELEPVRNQRADAAARVRQRRFGAEACAGDERHEGRDHDAGGVAIVEASGLAELLHDVGKDAVVIAKELYQQPDQQAADGTDQERKEARINTERLCGLFPKPRRTLLNEDDKGKSHQALITPSTTTSAMSLM